MPHFGKHYVGQLNVEIPVEHRLVLLEGHRRLQSLAFLVVGNICGVFGFGLAGLLGILRYKEGGVFVINAANKSFLSGKNYHPATVSEMVCNPASAEGKLWVAFNVTCAICILVSAYPWELTNVYIGHGSMFPPNKWSCCWRKGWPRVRALYLRQFFPPIGMLLVCFITVTTGIRDFYQTIGATAHTVGAVMMMVTYILFEVHHLWCQKAPSYWDPGDEKDNRRKREWRWRAFFIIAMTLCALSFQASGVALSQVISACATEKGFCSCNKNAAFTDTCVDVWKVPYQIPGPKGLNMNNDDMKDAPVEFVLGLHGPFDKVTPKKIGKEIEQALSIKAALAIDHGEAMLFNTARGWFLLLKQSCYWFEVFAGLFMIASHLCIALYSPDRNDHQTLLELESHPAGYKPLSDE